MDAAILGGAPVFGPTFQWPRWPVLTTADEQRVLTTLREDQWGIGSREIPAFAAAFAAYTGARFALPVSTGTAALEVTMKALGIGPGDEVIVPAYTFVATATCALELGASVLMADIDPLTFTLDPASVAQLLSPRTRAVIPVHFGGNPCDMEGLRRVIGDREIAIVEDACHAQGMRWRGQHAGTIGRAGCFSFQSSKNMSAGEGGIMITDDEELFGLAESFRSFGRKPGGPWYGHHYISWNHRLTALQAALLHGQLERLEAQTARRHAAGALLNAGLATIPGQTPQAPGDEAAGTRRAYHIYLWRYDAAAVGLSRELFLEALAAEGVPASAGYPLALQENPMFTERRFWHRHGLGGQPPQPDEPDYAAMRTPVTSRFCEESVWLPHAMLLADDAAMHRLVEAVARVVAAAPRIRDWAATREGR